MRIIDDIKLDFKDVLILPKRSTLNSRSEVSLIRDFKFKYSKYTWSGIPIIASNMDTVGTFEMAFKLDEFKMLTCIHKHYNEEDWKNFLEKSSLSTENIIYSLGSSLEDFEKFKKIYEISKNYKQIKWVCLDIANGYSQHFLKSIQRLRNLENLIIIAGNVVTPEMTEALILEGADLIKVGIGGGSVCTTRIKTGVGYPQLSAVIECADAAHGLGGHIISDGGCVVPGDIAKAFGGGADFVMLGSMLAGHKEAGEENLVYDKDGNIKGVYFYGMSSSTAMEKYYGGVNNYRSSEGKKVLLPYKGEVKNTVLDFLGGLRSACTYTGSKSIKELPKRTTFIRVNQQHNPVYDRYEIK
jgi:GMP reductase